MADLLHRPHISDVELRSDGRTIYGIVAPFDVEARVSDDGRHVYTEVFRRGAFTKTLAERAGRGVKLLVQHDGQSLPIGRSTLLEERNEGLYGEFRISKIQAGDEVIELIRDGALDSFSAGFREIRQRWSHDRARCERTEVALSEVSVVTFPAYTGAQIHGVRNHQPTCQIHPETARRRLELQRKRIR